MPDQEDTQAPEQTQAPAAEVPQEPDVTSPDFDWDKFFGTPVAPEAAGTPEEKFDEFEDEAANKLAAEVAVVKKQNAQILAKQQEQERELKVGRAIEEWKKTATPAELALSDLLYTATNAEELQARAAQVKAAAAKVEETYKTQIDEQIKAKEREMQQAFGMPLPPSFEPIPQADKARQALDQGDLDRAAALMLEGLFTP